MKTLLHVTSDEEVHFGHAIRAAALLEQDEELSHDDVTLLPHRWGVRLVTPDSPLAADVRDLIEQGVTVKAGATCFDANDLPRDALPGVEIVPSGTREVVRLQAAGYNYVKIP